jgi:hypothetical protein
MKDFIAEKFPFLLIPANAFLLWISELDLGIFSKGFKDTGDGLTAFISCVSIVVMSVLTAMLQFYKVKSLRLDVRSKELDLKEKEDDLKVKDHAEKMRELMEKDHKNASEYANDMLNHANED